MVINGADFFENGVRLSVMVKISFFFFSSLQTFNCFFLWRDLWFCLLTGQDRQWCSVLWILNFKSLQNSENNVLRSSEWGKIDSNGSNKLKFRFFKVWLENSFKFSQNFNFFSLWLNLLTFPTFPSIKFSFSRKFPEFSSKKHSN